MPVITNRQKRTWIVPPAAGFDSVIINPGQGADVPNEQWEAVRKDNRVIEALLSQRALTIGSASIDVEDLENPTSPQAPEELTDGPTDSSVTLEKVNREIVEVSTGNAPAEVVVTKGTKGGRK